MKRGDDTEMNVGSRIRRFALDALWPPACPVSGVPVDRSGHLSAAIWQDLKFLDAPWCAICGFPFPYPAGTNSSSKTQCPACIAKPPVYDQVRSPLIYDDASRSLVLGLKNGGRQELLQQFGRWMALAARDCLPEADALVPVPLHWRRLLSRRYNQSSLLAGALSRQADLPLDTDSLRRRRSTPSQAGRSIDARRRNMANAFVVTNPERVRGKALILVDDVFTTGATVAACTRQLKKAGASRVDVVTLCRVVRARDVTM
jgi:ComF family protein